MAANSDGAFTRHRCGAGFCDSLGGIRPVGLTEVRGPGDVHAVGHRVVHGGERFTESTIIDDDVLKGIEGCIELAPLHNPNNIKGILAARSFSAPARRRLRCSIQLFITRFPTSLSVRDSLPSLPATSHPAVRISWDVAPLRGVSVPCAKESCARADPRDYVALGERMLGGGDSQWVSGGYVDGHDAAGGIGDGHPFG